MTNVKKKWYLPLLTVLLVLYPLRHIWLGVELTDSAYSAGNYLYLEKMNPMWLFSTYLANKVGAVLVRFPFGKTMMGLNAYTALFISVVVAACFLFLVRMRKMPVWLAFCGEVLAISLCWCPTTILYNYLTYFFFDLAVISLYIGLWRDQRRYLALAGAMLGVNVLVRFPNVTEAALILTVWYYGFLVHKRGKDVLQETLICIGGFLAGAGIVLLQITIKYGFATYLDAIQKLMNMPSDASDYSPKEMILSPLRDYLFTGRFVIVALAGLVIISLVIMGAGKIVEWRLGGVIFSATGVLGMMALGYKSGVFNVKYYTYESMFQWVAIALIFTILFCIRDLVKQDVDRGQKLMAAFVLLIILLTPLGSNNHLYPNINHLFLVLPYFLDSMLDFWYRLVWAEEDGCKFPAYPTRVALILFTVMMSVQCFFFGVFFTFRDGMSGQKRDTKIEKNAILKGMVTNAELANSLEDLTIYLEEEHYEGRGIFYGNVPALSFFLDMEPAISTSWPDLRSYSMDVYQADMQKLKDAGEYPVIFVNREFYDAYLEDPEKDSKLALLMDFVTEADYTMTKQDTVITVFEKR
ncbi:MAG: hypothetical protein K6E48_08460 [Lachnospiraceae bacterium]|nr:hypothetical protein [Lachnospiraceae bacterium]